jgi:hypothetical protein
VPSSTSPSESSTTCPSTEARLPKPIAAPREEGHAAATATTEPREALHAAAPRSGT